MTSNTPNTSWTVVQQLDLRQTKCPLNFVQTRLALEKVELGEVIEVWLDVESQSVMNIPQSLAAEGHTVVYSEQRNSDPAAPDSPVMLCLGVQRAR